MFRIERSRDATTLAALSAAQIASSLNAEEKSQSQALCLENIAGSDVCDP